MYSFVEIDEYLPSKSIYVLCN